MVAVSILAFLHNILIVSIQDIVFYFSILSIYCFYLQIHSVLLQYDPDQMYFYFTGHNFL